MDPLDFAGLQGLVDEAMAFCAAKTPEAVNALAEGPMVFRVRGREMPLTTDNFPALFLPSERLLSRHHDLQHSSPPWRAPR